VAFAVGMATSTVSTAWAGLLPWTGDEPPLPYSLQDPHYGDSLFQFYQRHYFSALTGLMVSQHFDRLPHHADEAEVLRGGLLLSYGMRRDAQTIFQALIDRGAEPAVRDRAWFFLAKIHYQRGDLHEAEAAIARVGAALPDELAEDHAVLRARLLSERGDQAGAAAVLQRLVDDRDEDTALVARYNLGVAWVRAGQATRGEAWLDELGEQDAEDEEARSLRDKTNVALGYTALQAGHPEDARRYLERVRLHGMESNKALLGFGWAADELDDPKRALVPWQELAGRDPGDSAVLEAQLAVPYAYAKLGARGPALDGYQQAAAAYAQERGRLTGSIAQLKQGQWLDRLIERNPGEEMGWFWSVDDLPELPHAGHLQLLLAEHPLQEALKNYRDLKHLQANLAEWSQRLATFDDMLAHRRTAYAQRLPAVQANPWPAQADTLRQRRDVLAAEVQQAGDAGDGAALADSAEAALRTRIDGAQALADRHGDAPELAEARDRLRLARGVLQWRQSEAYPARIHEARKAIAAIDAALVDVARRADALARAQQDEPRRFEAYAVRLQALAARVAALRAPAAALADAQRVEVQAMAVAALERQQQRLDGYSAQARFAIAEMLDRSVSGTEARDGR